jgi:site-specific DNA recombinase
MPCDIPDEQMGRIISAIALPASWQDRLLARLHLEDEVKRVERERKEVEQRLKRLGQVYLDGLKPYEDYRREKRQLEERLQLLVVPGIDAAQQAGQLLENLPALWAAADLGERHKILLTMLDAVYVDTVEEKAIVAIRPKPAFQVLFQVATTKEGSGVVLYNEKASTLSGSSDDITPCFWWRRGRVELYPITYLRRSMLATELMGVGMMAVA